MNCSNSYLLLSACVVILCSLFIACTKQDLTVSDSNSLVQAIDQIPVVEVKSALSNSSNYTLHIFSDLTSSGGTRYFNSTLLIQNGKVISGEEEYTIWTTTGTHTTSSCIANVDHNAWLDHKRRLCTIVSVVVPLDFAELQRRVDYQDYLPAVNCTHRAICYDILT